MYDILVYLFETYYTPQACPQANVLAHKLAAAGFEDDDIHEALGWLHSLAQTTERYQSMPTRQDGGCRIYTDAEYQSLGQQAIGFVQFLENSGVLPPNLREILLEQAQMTSESPVSSETIRVIALMILWSQEAEVDHLVFEELLGHDQTRWAH